MEAALRAALTVAAAELSQRLSAELLRLTEEQRQQLAEERAKMVAMVSVSTVQSVSKAR